MGDRDETDMDDFGLYDYSSPAFNYSATPSAGTVVSFAAMGEMVREADKVADYIENQIEAFLRSEEWAGFEARPSDGDPNLFGCFDQGEEAQRLVGKARQDMIAMVASLRGQVTRLADGLARARDQYQTVEDLNRRSAAEIEALFGVAGGVPGQSDGQV